MPINLTVDAARGLIRIIQGRRRAMLSPTQSLSVTP